MKQVRIAPPASEEFTEAVRWGEAKRVGLGAEFYDAVLSTVALVREHPEIGVTVDGPHPHRQFLVDGFPYKLVCRERTDDLYIVAMAHASLRPRVLEATAVVDSISTPRLQPRRLHDPGGRLQAVA